MFSKSKIQSAIQSAMITISAVSFLMNFRTMPLSLLIPQLESQSFIEGTAMVSMIILILNLVEKGIAYAVKRMIVNEDAKMGVSIQDTAVVD